MNHDHGYLLLLTIVLVTPSLAVEITPNDVYTQLFKVNEEVNLIKQYLHITETIQVPEIKANFSPRHTWQKSYEVFVRLNRLREKHGLPVIAISSSEPIKHHQPLHIYEQTLRLLTELHIIKFYLNIQTVVPDPPSFTDKTITDNYNLLNSISYQFTLINGETFTPSHVFAEAMRINDDTDTLLEVLAIKDTTIPPPKHVNAIPANTFAMATNVLTEIQRLQKQVDIDTIDLEVFRVYQNITPSEVFGLTGIILAELQTLKAHLKLKYELTPLANHYENKRPADAEQILGWVLRKLQLIHSLD
jgi:hypothetical protein